MKREEIPKKYNIIKPPRLSLEDIRNFAEDFRSKYVKPIDLVPVPIMEIVEVDLEIYPIPEANLKAKIEMDGFLTRDLKNICVDKDVYIEDKNLNRLKFTYAHEVGHFFMHKDQIQSCDFRTPEDWKDFHKNFEEDDLGSFEYQAYEFAGRLLVPKEKLLEEVGNLGSMIKEFKKSYDNHDDPLIEKISKEICNVFGVSHQVIFKRIIKERIFKELGF